MYVQWLTILLCSLLLTSIFGLLQVDDDKFELEPSSGAQWLSLNDSASVFYVRTEVNVLGEVEHALLSLKARDEYEVWLNGIKVSGVSINGALNASRFDIGQALRPGKNILGIKVASVTRGKVPAVQVLLAYQDATGQHRIVSDKQWQASALVDQAVTKQQGDWARDVHSETVWVTPRLLYEPVQGRWKKSGLPLLVDPFLTRGNWFWPNDLSQSRVIMQRDITYESDNEFVLGVSVDGYYSLAINGQNWVARAASERSVVLHNLRPLLSVGDNRLSIIVESNALLPKMTVVGYHQQGSFINDLSHPDGWVFGEKLIPVTLFEPLNDRFPSLSFRELDYNVQYGFYVFSKWLYLIVFLSVFSALVVWSVAAIKGLPRLQLLKENAILWLFVVFLWSFLFVLARFGYVNFSFLQQQFILFNLALIIMLNLSRNVIFTRGPIDNA